MKIIKIKSINSLIKHLNSLPNNFVYRGQADSSWKLAPSLERILGEGWSAEKVQKFEDFSIQQFKSKFHLYDRENGQPESKLAWLSVMQHHGVPTRLLDFTESPYVALYFAMEAYDPMHKRDLALYAIDYSSILEKSICYLKTENSLFKETRATVVENQDEIFDKVIDKFSYPIVWIAEPRILNARLDKQAGSFLLSGDRSIRLENVLSSSLYASCDTFKHIISADLYEAIFALLRKMNITSKSLYGDLDGLARSIRMQLQVYAA